MDSIAAVSPRRRPAPRALRWGALALLLLASGFYFSTGLDWGLPAANARSTWVWDEVAPPQAGPWLLRYPPLHRDTLEAVAAIAQTVAPDRFAGRSAAGDGLMRLARWVSLAYSVGTLWLLYRLGRLVGPRSTALLPPLAYLTLLPTPYYGRAANLEAPYLFWFAAALWFWQRARQRGRRRDLLAYAACGALSFLVKDQALALFLLPTVWLVAERHVAFRQTRVPGGPNPLVGLYATVLAAGGVVLALTAVVYRLPWRWSELLAHLHEITHDGSVRYRMFAASLAGQWEMLRAAGRSLEFVVGGAGLLLAALAVACAASDRASARRRLPLLLFPLSYYLFFIAVIGYHYDRFFLPVAMTFVLFLPTLAERAARWARPAWTGALIALVPIAEMSPQHWEIVERTRDDTRYDVERLLAAPAHRHLRVGAMGDPMELPRGRGSIYRYWRIWDDPCGNLGKYDWLLFNELQASWRESTRTLHEAVRSGRFGFDRLARYDRAREDVIDFSGLISNLVRASPPIEIFHRVSPICAVEPIDWYAAARASGDPRELDRFGRHLTSPSWAAARVRDDASGLVLAFGTTPDGWVADGRSALIVAAGRSGKFPRLAVAHWAPAEHFPVELRLTAPDGATTTLELDQGGVSELELPAPPSGRSVGLWELSVDRGWTEPVVAPATPRQLGVQIVGAEGD